MVSDKYKLRYVCKIDSWKEGLLETPEIFDDEKLDLIQFNSSYTSLARILDMNYSEVS